MSRTFGPWFLCINPGRINGMQTFARYRIPIFFGAVFIFSTFQTVLFHEHAFEMSALLVKEATGVASIREQKKMGAICNSVERYRCSIRHFEKVLEKYPFDREALGNLAVASAMSEDFNRAQSYFSAYFGSGGTGHDVTYWYAQTLHNMGRQDEAMRWVRDALVEIPLQSEYGQRLAKFLQDNENRSLASPEQ
jgi:tetratricopeptide (TPR) repeat protein